MDKFFAVMAVCFNLYYMLFKYIYYGLKKKNMQFMQSEEIEQRDDEVNEENEAVQDRSKFKNSIGIVR